MFGFYCHGTLATFYMAVASTPAVPTKAGYITSSKFVDDIIITA